MSGMHVEGLCGECHANIVGITFLCESSSCEFAQHTEAFFLNGSVTRMLTQCRLNGFQSTFVEHEGDDVDINSDIVQHDAGLLLNVG